MRRKALREQLGLTNKEFKALSREYKTFEVPKQTRIPLLGDNGEGGYKIIGWKKHIGSATITECVSAIRKVYQELKKFERNPDHTSTLRQLPAEQDLEALQQQILADETVNKGEQ
jgi:hypothetical protein